MTISPLASHWSPGTAVGRTVLALVLLLGPGMARGADTPGTLTTPAARGAGPVTKRAALPRKTPAATNAPAGFHLAPGFRIELVAAEPLLASPLAMAFDERGRLFLIESLETGVGDGAGPVMGRVRLLEEPDEQGVFQVSSVYAESVPRASALACYHGGVFVASAPNILYLKDRQGNSLADLRSVVLTGLDPGTNAFRPQRLPNNFNWGLDHRIHVAGGGLGGVLFAPAVDGARAIAVDGHDFSFEPRTLAVAVEAGPSRSGLSFDSLGRKLACDPGCPLRQPIFEPRYYARNPYFPAPAQVVDAADPATRVFRWDATKVASLSGGGAGALTPAWLTAAQGCVIYRGGLFPTNYLDHAFVADPDGHLIHHLVLRENGLRMEARRPAEERASEFLISTDPAFRPMQVVNGPDGALYIADHRIAPGEGRIYRIVPEHFPPAVVPRLDQAKTIELVTALAQTNGWAVDTAARLLYERQDPAAVGWLTNMFLYSKLPAVRLRALHSLEAQGALGIALVDRGLKDPDPQVREHALLLLERLVRNGFAPVAIWDRLEALSQDTSLRVRYQLALTLGYLDDQGKGPILAALLGRDIDNPWMRAAILSSLGDVAGPFLVRLAASPGFRGMPGGWPWIEDLATMIGVRGHLDDVTLAVELVDRDLLPQTPSFLLLSALGEGMRRTQSSLALVDPSGRLQRFSTTARLVVANESADWAGRAAAARLLGTAALSYTNTGDWLRALLAPAEPALLQAAAVAALGHYDHPRVTTDLLLSWRALTLPVRWQAGAALLGRSERVRFVLDALQAGRIAPQDLAPSQINFLRTHADPVISARARELLGSFAPERPAVVQRFRPAAHLPGDASRGRGQFMDRCAACHQLAGTGQTLGPSLAGFKVWGRERILTAILEPSLEIAPAYATTVVETKLGEVLIGIKSDQGPATFTLRQPGGLATVWALESVRTMETQPWSLMPEGLEQGMEPQDMADLLEYIVTAPSDPYTSF